MNSLLFSPLAIYEAQCSVLQAYLDTLSHHIRNRALHQLPQEKEEEKPVCKIFPFERVQRYHSPSNTHDVEYYDFIAHSPISSEKYYDALLQDFIKQAPKLSSEITKEQSRIRHVFPRYTYRLFRIMTAYIDCLLHPLFRFDHYARYKTHRIGVQEKEWNIVYAFSYSPEEMELYKTFSHLEATWWKEKEMLVQWVSNIVNAYEHIRRIQLQSALSTHNLPGKEEEFFLEFAKHTEEAEKDVLFFLEHLRTFDLTMYRALDKDTLQSTRSKVVAWLPSKK